MKYIAASPPHRTPARVSLVNISQAYGSGLSLRKIGAEFGINHPFSVACLLERAGIPRRPNGTAHLHPRVTIVCDICGQQFQRSQFHVKFGNSTRSKPNPPAARFCSSSCKARGHSRWLIERARHIAIVQVDYR